MFVPSLSFCGDKYFRYTVNFIKDFVYCPTILCCEFVMGAKWGLLSEQWMEHIILFRGGCTYILGGSMNPWLEKKKKKKNNIYIYIILLY